MALTEEDKRRLDAEGIKQVEKATADWKPERFSGFWDFYPRKGRKNKQRAIAAWDRLKPNDELIATIGHALVLLKATDEWKREIGIPHVTTFLNGERWHDADELEDGDGQSAADGGAQHYSRSDFGWQE